MLFNCRGLIFMQIFKKLLNAQSAALSFMPASI